MDVSKALGIFSDEELQLIFNRSGCLGRFRSWLSRVRGNRNPCCNRQRILEDESLRCGGKVLCISNGSKGSTIWAGDCLDGLKAKLSEIRSKPEPNSKEMNPEPEEVQDHEPKTISTKPEAPIKPKDIMEIEPNFPE